MCFSCSIWGTFRITLAFFFVCTWFDLKDANMARYLKKHQKRLNARGTCSGTFAPKPLIPQTNSGSECMPFICGPKNRLIPGRWYWTSLQFGSRVIIVLTHKLQTVKAIPFLLQESMLYVSNSESKWELLLSLRHHSKICFCIHSIRSIIWIVNFQGYDELWVNRGLGGRIIKNRAKTEKQIRGSWLSLKKRQLTLL